MGVSLNVTRDAAGDLHDFVTGCFMVFESVLVGKYLILLGIACVCSLKSQRLRLDMGMHQTRTALVSR